MNKEKLPIIVGLALPIFFIVFVAVWISFRTSSVQPEHSFIYSISDETSPAKYGVRFENNYVIVMKKKRTSLYANKNDCHDM